MLVNSLVVSRLDYCNSVLNGVPKYQGANQRESRTDIAARMITGTRSTDHITPVSKSLHWLQVKARINFKILLITYKILKRAIYQLFRIYHTRIPPIKNTEIINSFTAMGPIYQIQFLWLTHFFSSCTGIMELNSRIHQKSRHSRNI